MGAKVKLASAKTAKIKKAYSPDRNMQPRQIPGIPRAPTYDATLRMIKTFCSNIPDDDYAKFAGLMACGTALSREVFDEADKTPKRPFSVVCPEEMTEGSLSEAVTIDELASDHKFLLMCMMSFMTIGKVQSKPAVQQRLKGFLAYVGLLESEDLIEPLVTQFYPVLKRCNKAYTANIEFTRKLIIHINSLIDVHCDRLDREKLLANLCVTVLRTMEYAQMSIVPLFKKYYHSNAVRLDPMFLAESEKFEDTVARLKEKYPNNWFPLCKVLRLPGHEELECSKFPYIHAAISLANPGFAQPEPGTPAYAAREVLAPKHATEVDLELIMYETMPMYRAMVDLRNSRI